MSNQVDYVYYAQMLQELRGLEEALAARSRGGTSRASSGGGGQKRSPGSWERGGPSATNEHKM